MFCLFSPNISLRITLPRYSIFIETFIYYYLDFYFLLLYLFLLRRDVELSSYNTDQCVRWNNLEFDGIINTGKQLFPKNIKVLNNPKGKPVILTLLYIIKIIFNYIKHLIKSYLKQYLPINVR